jgi:hypothetical protein
MHTTKHRGTPDALAGRRLPDRRPCRKALPAMSALAGALLIATLVGTACSSGYATASGTGQSLSQGDQEMVSFTRCMRAHGVQMSDPYHRPGHTGLTLDLPTQDAATRPAYAACTHYIGPIIQAKQAGAAALAAPRMAALTRYAECMRSHDIAMLDPSAQGQLNLGNVAGMAGNHFGRYSPQFRSADAACRHLLPAGVTYDGSGP